MTRPPNEGLIRDLLLETNAKSKESRPKPKRILNKGSSESFTS